MNTIKSIVPETDKTHALKIQVTEVRKTIRNYEKHDKANEEFKVVLGNQLIALKTLFHQAMNNKRAGFHKWAAQQFKRSPKTIESYMGYARNPARLETDRNRTWEHNPLKRAKNAYLKLSPTERQDYLIWLDQLLKDEEPKNNPRKDNKPMFSDRQIGVAP